MMCSTLSVAQKNMVDFDPHNAQHLEAYRSLCIGETKATYIHISQHPTLRFRLEAPFETVPAMLHYKVGVAYLQRTGMV